MIHHLEVQVLILLLIASLVGMLARRIRVPYTLALVVAGLGLSFVHLRALDGLSLTPDLLLLLFLPPLLFEAAYHLPFRDLRKNAVHIVYLAVIGVLMSVGLTAALTYVSIGKSGLLSSFGWAQAFLFASVLAATDPISVLALFKELGAPKRLYQVVEGESLVNDGVAVVVFAIIGAVVGADGGTAPALHGAREVISYAVVTFIRSGVGGLLVGAAVGALASVLARQIDDHLIEITLTTLVAWGSFLVAEQLHVSGVLSTVAAGVMIGSFGKNYGMTASTRIAVQDFWEYMGFLSNSFIFLFIGLELDPAALFGHGHIVLLAFVALTLARAVVIYLGLPIADRFTVPLPKKWRHVLVWGGLRGSLSMVLVLGLPTHFEGRALLIDLVFGVVSVSLFLQGLTMGPLMKRLGVQGTAGLAMSRDYELARGRAIACRSVINRATQLFEQGLLDEPTFRRLSAWYEQSRTEARGAARRLAGIHAGPERLLEGARTLATVERDTIDGIVRDGVISEGAGSELMADINRRLDGLDRAAHEGEPQLLGAFDELYPAEVGPSDPVEHDWSDDHSVDDNDPSAGSGSP